MKSRSCMVAPHCRQRHQHQETPDALLAMHVVPLKRGPDTRAARPTPPNQFALGNAPTSTPAPCQLKPTAVGQHNGCDPYSNWVVLPEDNPHQGQLAGLWAQYLLPSRVVHIPRPRTDPWTLQAIHPHHKHLKGSPPRPYTILWSVNRNRNRFLPGTPPWSRQHT